MKTFIITILTTFAFFLHAQEPLSHQIFNSDGEETTFQQMALDLVQYDVVFFGEHHTNPIAHWLQLELAGSLYSQRNGNLILGAEMFERDAQLVLDEYLAGYIKESHLISEGKAWDNYQTDYAPLVNFAKDNSLPFYATNVPRRYANLVSKQGIDSLENLSKEAKKELLPPLPIEVPMDLPSYQSMKAMMGGHGMRGNVDWFIQAQAIKDATMGYSIVEAMKENKGALMLHFNGNFHSKDHEGTAWYVNHYNSKLKVAVISFVEQEFTFQLEENNLGNNEYTIVCPSNMTKTSR